MKKTVHENLLQIYLSAPDGEPFRIEACLPQFFYLANLDPIYQFHCENASAGEVPVYPGYVHHIVIGKITGESLHISRFQSVVQFLPDESGEFIYNSNGVIEFSVG